MPYIHDPHVFSKHHKTSDQINMTLFKWVLDELIEFITYLEAHHCVPELTEDEQQIVIHITYGISSNSSKDESCYQTFESYYRILKDILYRSLRETPDTIIYNPKHRVARALASWWQIHKHHYTEQEQQLRDEAIQRKAQQQQQIKQLKEKLTFEELKLLEHHAVTQFLHYYKYNH